IIVVAENGIGTDFGQTRQDRFGMLHCLIVLKNVSCQKDEVVLVISDFFEKLDLGARFVAGQMQVRDVKNSQFFDIMTLIPHAITFGGTKSEAGILDRDNLLSILAGFVTGVGICTGSQSR